MPMPSPLHREELVSMAAAAAWVRARNGKKTHVSTLYRWALRGCRGKKLETVLIGRERMTSKPALERFFELMPEPDSTVRVDVTPKAPHKVARDVEQLHSRIFKKKPTRAS